MEQHLTDPHAAGRLNVVVLEDVIAAQCGATAVQARVAVANEQVVEPGRAPLDFRRNSPVMSIGGLNTSTVDAERTDQEPVDTAFGQIHLVAVEVVALVWIDDVVAVVRMLADQDVAEPHVDGRGVDLVSVFKAGDDALIHEVALESGRKGSLLLVLRKSRPANRGRG